MSGRKTKRHQSSVLPEHTARHIDRTPFIKNLLVAFSALLLATFAVYANSLFNEFSQLDDYDYIVTYGHFDRPLTIKSLRHIFFEIPSTESIHDYYRPVYILIRTIDYRIGKTNPFGYHLTNLTFYFFACVMLYLICRRLLGSHLYALATALLFAVHPVHVEAVSWIMAGGYPISFFFMCFSFYAFMRFFGETHARYAWLSASVAGYLSAALCNPPAIVLPALFVFYSVMQKHSLRTRGIIEGYSAIGLASFVMAALDFYIFPAPYISGAFKDTFTAVLTSIHNLAQAIFIMALPTGMHTPVEYAVYSPLSLRFIFSALFLAGLGFLFVREFKKRSLYAFAIGWFFIALLPSVSLWKSITSFTLRYLLPSSFAFSLVSVLLLAKLAAYLEARKFAPATARTFFLLLCLPLFLAYSALTVQANTVWKNTETLFRDTLKKSPGNFFASLSLSAYYTINQRVPEKALAFLPDSIAFHENLMARFSNETLVKTQKFIITRLRNNLGNAFAETQQVERAIQEHEKAAALMPDSHEPWFYLGMDYEKRAELLDQGAAAAADRKKALEQSLYSYEECIRKNPRHAPAYGNIGLVLYQLGRLREAETILKQALGLSPNNFKMAGLLAEIFAATGRSDAARTLLQRSIAQARYRSDETTVTYMSQQLAAIEQGVKNGTPSAGPAAQGTSGFQEFVSLFTQKRYAEALAAALQEEKKMSSPDPVFINNIGMAFYKTGDLASAEAYFTRAISLNKSYDKAYYNLALVYTKQNNIEKGIEYCRKALAINPQYRAAQTRLETLLQAKQQAGFR